MKKLLSIILISVSVHANGQMITPKVVASSGGFFSNSAGMLSFTVGELAAITTLTSANNFLTQGFQQPSDFGVYVPSVDAKDFSMNVFPNPSSGNFSITIKTPRNYSMTYFVFDMLGQIVIASDKRTFQGDMTLPLDLTRQITGVYLLECTFTDSQTGKQFKNYSKLNLVY